MFQSCRAFPWLVACSCLVPGVCHAMTIAKVAGLADSASRRRCDRFVTVPSTSRHAIHARRFDPIVVRTDRPAQQLDPQSRKQRFHRWRQCGGASHTLSPAPGRRLLADPVSGLTWSFINWSFFRSWSSGSVAFRGLVFVVLVILCNFRKGDLASLDVSSIPHGACPWQKLTVQSGYQFRKKR